MKIYTFIAESAPEAVAQIRAQLGPEAVVLNVRKVEPDGLQKIWRKPRIEVLAHLPEPEPVPALDASAALSDLRREIADLRQQFPREVAKAPEPILISEAPPVSRQNYGGWKVGGFLEQTGVLPRHVETILSCVERQYGEIPPEGLAKELDLVRGVIAERFQGGVTTTATRVAGGGVHAFVGAPGSGKTTVLSKMLARHVLMDALPARVLRLDGMRASTAESLSVYCEILGVPLERCLAEMTPANSGETTFIDLPGVSASDSDGIRSLGAILASFPAAQVHLTLNAAYETNTLLNQARAFSALPISSLVFTHLDEEPRWGKLLNFIFGTKFAIRQLSAGQNVPGDLFPATAEKILSRLIPSK